MISDPIAAFCFDRATTLWGRAIESEVHKKTKDAKNDATARTKEQQVMTRWLYIDGAQQAGRFADPVARMRTGTLN